MTIFYSSQLIGVLFLVLSISLIVLKTLLPKNQLYAEKGDGWADSNMKCFVVSINDFFPRAKFPHNTNITPEVFFEISEMTVSVKVSHPIFAWLAGSHACTVNIAFIIKTHWLAQGVRFPLFEGGIHTSASSSLYIFFRLGGSFSHSTEKLSQWAWFGPWYGSWPRMTTLRFERGVREKASNTLSRGG